MTEIKKYATYAEASTATQALGIKSMAEYKTLFKEDPKLPASPDRFYKNLGWVDWYDFLGNEKPSGK